MSRSLACLEFAKARGLNDFVFASSEKATPFYHFQPDELAVGPLASSISVRRTRTNPSTITKHPARPWLGRPSRVDAVEMRVSAGDGVAAILLFELLLINQDLLVRNSFPLEVCGH